MISEMFSTVTQAITSFGSALGQGVTSVTSLFWVTSGEGAGPTFLGTLVLIAVGVGIVYFVFRLIMGLIGRRRA